jgi:hypothetical protein
MNLDNNNSRLLGIGERVDMDCYVQCAASGDWHCADHMFGQIVCDDTPDVRRMLPNKVSFSTGALRNNAEGRGRFDLIPYEAMLCLARRLEFGISNGYEPRNWEKGMPLSRILSSMRRHAMQVNYDYSEDHLGAVLFNAAAFATIAERIRAGILPKELDDIGYLERATP